MIGKTQIFVRHNGILKRVKYDQILCIAAMGDYITITTLGENLVIHSTLKSFTAFLPEELFFRCHRSYTVNLSRVETIEDYTAYLETRKYIPIGEHYKKELLYKLNCYNAQMEENRKQLLPASNHRETPLLGDERIIFTENNNGSSIDHPEVKIIPNNQKTNINELKQVGDFIFVPNNGRKGQYGMVKSAARYYGTQVGMKLKTSVENNGIKVILEKVNS